MAIRAAWSLATLLGLASPALAEDCRLALVLALDVSGSVDAQEDLLQREGLAHALLAPDVVRAFLWGDPVAVHAFEWSGHRSQTKLLSDWQLIRSQDDLARVAAAIAHTHRSKFHDAEAGTALGAALAYADQTVNEAPECRAQTVDVSGDGISNIGPAPAAIYASGRLDEVTVNALVVGGATDSHDRVSRDRQLVTYFEAEVLHGPDAFWILANGYEDYERAMAAKLLRELEAPMVSGLSHTAGGA